MAVDMFLKIDDIKGEAQDSKHKDTIDVLAWSWGLSQSGSASVGGGAGAGKVNVQDLSITKFIDKSSPVLEMACCTGKHFKQAILTVRKAGEKPLEYIKLTMKDLIITSISKGGSGGEDRLTENITLSFAEFKSEYVPQKPDGSGDAAIEAAYNIKQNVKV